MLVCSGRMCSGKDYVAIKAGYECVSIAEPLYRLASFYLGTKDKKVPEVRAFMQALGAWGRGEEGPDSAGGIPREKVFSDVRNSGAKMTGLDAVDWENFGTKKTFWLNSAADVAEKLAGQGVKVAITNARFPEELEELKNRGFRHVHVMCTEAARLNRAGREYNPSIDEDTTEKMAIGLNDIVREKGGKSAGNGIVVWNDLEPIPYKDLVSTQSFVQMDAALTSKLERAKSAISPFRKETKTREQ